LKTIRALSVLVLALASALLVAACGGGGNSEDPQQVLQQTFSNPTSIQSGTFDLDVRLETSGGDNPGSFEAKLGGKFASQGADKFPKFDIDASVKAEGGSQSLSGTGGLISTGDQAFVNFQGTNYSVPQQLYDEFTTTYAQLQGQNGSSKSTSLLKALNISPANWLTDLKNDGTADVEGRTSRRSPRRRAARSAASTPSSSISSTTSSSPVTSTSIPAWTTSCCAGSRSTPS
jgi:hypothetical protein